MILALFVINLVFSALISILYLMQIFYEVEDLFCGASSGSEPSLFFTNYLFGLGFKPSQDDFYHDLARVTDKADGSVFLAVLTEALLGNVKISDGLWGRPFSCSPDLVTDLC